MAIYVAFNDSASDPTYCGATDAVLVRSDSSEENPCVDYQESVSVLPNTESELEAFASIQGWSIGYDNDGQIILYTGVSRS